MSGKVFSDEKRGGGNIITLIRLMVLMKSIRVSVSLVEEVIVDFDLSVGFEVIRQEHDRNRNLAEIIDLHKGQTYIKVWDCTTSNDS